MNDTAIHDSDPNRYSVPTRQLAVAPPDHVFMIHSNGEEVARLKLDGTLTVNPAYSVGDAARIFWESVRKLAAVEQR